MSHIPRPGGSYIVPFWLTLRTVVSQLHEARTFTVNRFYNWSQTHRWNEPRLFPGYRFAVAYAVDKRTAYDRTNGSLGLGPMQFVKSSEMEV